MSDQATTTPVTTATPAPKPATAPSSTGGFTRAGKEDPRQASATTAPKAAEPSIAAPPKPDETDAKTREIEAQVKRFAHQQKKFSDERAAFQKQQSDFETQKREFEEWRSLRTDMRRNPAKYLEKDFGENWYDTLTKYKLEGAPTSDLIASDVDGKLSELKKQLEEREGKINQRFEQLAQAESAKAMAEYQQGAISFIKSNAEKFPLVSKFEEFSSVLFEIDKHFRETIQKNPDGTFEPGELLTAEEAAGRVEKRIEAIRQKFLDDSPGKAPTPTQSQNQRNETQHRRSLSTNMTASTGSDWKPPKDDNERLRRATAAWERAVAERQQ